MFNDHFPCTHGDKMRGPQIADKPWIGKSYEQTRILVLGESWYGDWGSDYNSDSSYVAGYLAGAIRDSMYSKMANACGAERQAYWESILFTNFVTWAGNKRTDRPTRVMYEAAVPRLERLLQIHMPRGVWILGKEQSEFSASVVRQAGIAFEVSFHPTSYGLRNQVLGESWHRLTAKIT
jgi:hypothetical protein